MRINTSYLLNLSNRLEVYNVGSMLDCCQRQATKTMNELVKNWRVSEKLSDHKIIRVDDEDICEVKRKRRNSRRID